MAFAGSAANSVASAGVCGNLGGIVAATITAILGYPCNRSCPTPWLSTGGSPEAAPTSAGTHVPAPAVAGLSEVDGWR